MGFFDNPIGSLSDAVSDLGNSVSDGLSGIGNYASDTVSHWGDVLKDDVVDPYLSSMHDFWSPVVDSPYARPLARLGSAAIGMPGLSDVAYGVNDAANGRSENNVGNLASIFTSFANGPAWGSSGSPGVNGLSPGGGSDWMGKLGDLGILPKGSSGLPNWANGTGTSVASPSGGNLWELGAKGLGTIFGGNAAYGNAGQARDQFLGNNDLLQRELSSMPSLESMYGPNSPYALQLKRTLAAKDAKAGRNSQYGSREAQYQALLADKGQQYARDRANVVSQYNTGLGANAEAAAKYKQQQDQIRAQQLGSLFNVGQQAGLFNSLSSLFS